MIPANHAKQLETLCQSYAAADRKKQYDIRDELMRFTYMQCQPKILQRFDTPLHPFSKRHFYGVFEPGAITSSVLVDNIKSIEKSSLNLSSKILKGNEDDIRGIATKIIGYKFKLDQEKHIILDSESTPHYHAFVWYLLNAYRKSLGELSDLRKTNKQVRHDTRITSANTVLDMINKVAEVLADLAYRSTSFQMHLQHQEVKKWLVQAALQDEPCSPPLSQVSSWDIWCRKSITNCLLE
jgi:hypothetical protein